MLGYGEQKIVRTFVFEREDTHQSIIAQLEVDLSSELININSFLSCICPLRSCNVAIYDPIINNFVELNRMGANQGIVAKRFIQPLFVLVRYTFKEQLFREESNFSESFKGKEERSKERSIQEVINLVRRWRHLHSSQNKPRSTKKMSLQEAAKLVGISKKSLDDYYCQLRIAEENGFDFSNNLHLKMGVIRNFVKQHQQRDEKGHLKKHTKHSRRLRIIDDYLLNYTDNFQSIRSQSPQKQSQIEQSQQEIIIFNQREVIFGQDELDVLQQHFYEDFKLFVDDPVDPFVCPDLLFLRRISEDSDPFHF